MSGIELIWPFGYDENEMCGKYESRYEIRTSITGLQGSLDAGGIPQSSNPGIGGGFNEIRIRDSSSGGSNDAACWLEDGVASALLLFIASTLSRVSSMMSSDIWARG